MSIPGDRILSLGQNSVSGTEFCLLDANLSPESLRSLEGKPPKGLPEGYKAGDTEGQGGRQKEDTF